MPYIVHPPLAELYDSNPDFNLKSDLFILLLRPFKGADYCDQPVCLCVCVSVCVCLSASISLQWLGRSPRNFVCRSAVAVARSSSGGVVIRYVLPVLWMTSHMAIMGATPELCGCTVQRRP